MGRPRITPPDNELSMFLRLGYSHAEIADVVFERTGYRLSRSSISAAISRAGLSEQQNRYAEEIPWRVSEDHLRDYPVRMLRLLGRRRAGQPLNDEESPRLDRWLTALQEDNTVVVYDPQRGFAYGERSPQDPLDLPIHIPLVRLKEVA